MLTPPPLIVLLGPTASGKSAVAMDLAQRIGAEILSMDSMQVYRGMDIGTAKPSADERAVVVHHLIDVASPDQIFSVADFVTRADAVIADASSRGVPLIATGGTPLYYKALFEGLFEGPAASDELREGLNARPLDELHRELTLVDPAAAERIHVNDRRRLVRAMEVYLLTGRAISDHQSQWGSAPRHAAKWFGIGWEKDALNRRINARVKQMMADGWLEEARGLMERYPVLSKTAGEATGYYELIEHLHGRMALDDAIEQVKIATRQLARRQTKWFRRWQQITWLPGEQSSHDLASAVLGALDR